tara:strand:- start:5076 stop:5549 length:474 start_codon:yes stop_codon:yes gene_type:complete
MLKVDGCVEDAICGRDKFVGRWRVVKEEGLDDIYSSLCVGRSRRQRFLLRLGLYSPHSLQTVTCSDGEITLANHAMGFTFTQKLVEGSFQRSVLGHVSKHTTWWEDESIFVELIHGPCDANPVVMHRWVDTHGLFHVVATHKRGGDTAVHARVFARA